MRIYIPLISSVTCLAPLVLGILYFRRQQPGLKILTLFIVFAFLFDVISIILRIADMSYVWSLHVYTLGEFLFIGLVFFYLMQGHFLQKIIRLSMVFYSIIWIIAKFTFENFLEWDNYTASVSSVLIISLAAYCLFDLSIDHKIKMFNEPKFWISCAVIIYFTGNLLTFALANVIATKFSAQSSSIPLNSILSVVRNVFFSGGFLCLHSRRTFGGLSS